MKTLWPALAIALIFFSQSSLALKLDVNIPDSIKLYKNGWKQCMTPFACLKKGETNILTYDDKVWGQPKFLDSQITFADGSTAKGKLAIFGNTDDWSFVKRFAFFQPEGESMAYYLDSNAALLIEQQDKKGPKVFDRYGNTYLERLVSGKLRLTYNPAGGSTTKFVGGFISEHALDNLRKQAAQSSVKASLRDGKGIQAANDLDNTIIDAASSIEISEKEYLLFDEATAQTTAVTKASYQEIMTSIFASCAKTKDDKTAAKLAKKFKKIIKAVEYYNSNCQE